MGSFSWDNPCFLQYHNGRPLSVALTEPCDCQLSTFVESDFAIQPPHVRSNSASRRYHREAYRIYQPNVQYTSFFCSPALPSRQIYRSSSGDMLVEKLETVTIEEQQCRPSRCGTAYMRSPSPPVRQVKIRSRPSSCYDLHNREAADRRCTKYVDEEREEHYKFNFSYNLPPSRVVPVQRPPTPSRFTEQQEITTVDEGFNFHIEAKPALRRSTRSIGTTTKDLRPLSRSETQVIERFEKDEKLRHDSMTETTTAIVTEQRPLQRSLYGATTSKSHNALNIWSDSNQHEFSNRHDYLDRYDRNSSRRPVVRPTAKHEALVDTYEIVAPPTPTYTSTIPITFESRSFAARHEY